MKELRGVLYFKHTWSFLNKIISFLFIPLKNKYPPLPIYMSRVQIDTQSTTLSETELLLNVTV